jgi:integrase/recombinase XerD
MRERSSAKRRKVRGKQTNTQFADGLGGVVRETTRLWRKHHLGYDQTKYVVEQVRRRLTLLPPSSRRRTVNRLDKIEVERLIQNTYQSHSKYGLMIKTLFLSGARSMSSSTSGSKTCISTATRRKSISATARKSRTAIFRFCLPSRRNCARIWTAAAGVIFSKPIGTIDIRSVRCNRSSSPERVRQASRSECIHICFDIQSRQSLLDSGQVPIDQVQKFLGHLQLSTTQIYTETSVKALGDNYVRALGGTKA